MRTSIALFLAVAVPGAVVGSAVTVAGGSLSGTATPSGIADFTYSRLASQDQSGFGEAIVFVPAAYTPPGIVEPMRLALASHNHRGFGYEIAFVPNTYTPPGIKRVDMINAVAAR